MFWLVPESIEADPPYYKAICSFQRLSHVFTPWEKVDVLVDSGKVIIDCIYSHWGDRKSPEELIV